MIFNEQTAGEIIEKFNLDPKTIKVWKTRGSIPDKYFKEGYSVEEKITDEKEKREAESILSILSLEKINRYKICELCEIKNSRMADIQGCRATIRKDELVSLKKLLNKLKIDAKDLLQSIETAKYGNYPEASIKKFLTRSELKYFVFLNREKEVYARFEAWISGRRVFPNEDIDRLKQAIAVLIIELAI